MRGGGRFRRLARSFLPSTEEHVAESPRPDEWFDSSLGDDEREIVDTIRPYTMTSPQRIVASIDAVDYVVRRDIRGALVECGVWLGGNVLAMIAALQRAGVDDRHVYLFDTFEGMTEPVDVDTSRYDEPAVESWTRAGAAGERPWSWYFDRADFSRDAVERRLLETGYPAERIHLVEGRVEDTLPQHAPETIAVLRLDTDWYESTRHELEHLYPRLATGGVLLIDDYGHWDGCRRAVDEYFSARAAPVLLSRTDYTGRMAIKH